MATTAEESHTAIAYARIPLTWPLEADCCTSGMQCHMQVHNQLRSSKASKCLARFTKVVARTLVLEGIPTKKSHIDDDVNKAD